MREPIRRHNGPRHAKLAKAKDQCPTEVDLARLDSELGGTRKGVMVVVPALAHADQTRDLHVVALNACATYDPSLATFAVCVMPN